MTTPLKNNNLQNNTPREYTSPSKNLTIFAFAAIAAAAIPHLFLEFPHLLLAAGQKRAFFGLSVWAPLALAAAALLTDTSLQERFKRPAISTDIRTAAAVLLPLAVIAIMTQLHFDPPFLGRPLNWQKPVLIAMGLYATIQALESLFWQGLMQHRIFHNTAPAIRIILVTLLNIAIVLPFAASTGFAVATSTYLLDVGIIALSGAILFELGLQTRAVMLARALMGAGYAWAFHHLFF